MPLDTKNVPLPQALHIAAKHLQSNKIVPTEEICRRVLKVDPKNAEAHHLLGLAAFKRRRYDIAVELIKKAVSFNGTVPSYYSNLGLALNSMGKSDDAIATYKRAIAFKPDYAEVYNNLGTAYNSKGRHEDALESYKKAIELKPDYAEAYYNSGIVLRELARREEAVESYKKAIEIRPKYPEAYNNMAFAMHELTLYDEAVEAYKKAIEIWPRYSEAYNNMGAVYLVKGEFDEAIINYQKAIAINPAYAEAFNNMGFALDSKGKHEEALISLDKALALKPDYVEALMNRGSALKDLNRLDEAVESYERAALLKPELSKPKNIIGTIRQQQGRFEDARAAYLSALRIDPTIVGAYRNIVQSGKFKEEDLPILEEIEGLINKSDMREEDMCELHYALGKINDDLKRYDQAFPHFIAANDIARKKFEFSHEEHAAKFGTLIDTFTPDFMAARKDWGATSDLPIVVFGMMRSGTTLVEQIIASHPSVHGAGELSFWDEQERKFKEKEKKYADLSKREMQGIGEDYVSFLRGFSSEKPFVTDKMPGNYQRAGLINLACPNARIIHCKRNPIDTCLSIYFIKFAGFHPYAYSLEDLAFYYKQYLRLMEHWRSVLPADKFLEVQYEDVVADQEAMSRKLIEFCGLPWDDACLNFHLNERPIKTASNWQVRQPLYSSSVGRWMNYEKYLGPLAELIEAPQKPSKKKKSS